MSALGGIWNFDASPGAGDSCRRILNAQRLYGPDHVAQWDDGAIALGRALFETLPEDRYDRQPLVGGDGRFVLVADVRLDNRDELARDLGIAAIDAQRLPDAAFVLRAWEQWGEALFDRLYGDYAFALWDVASKQLTLARDHLGARPLHYHQGKGMLAFASMPKGLHALPEIPSAPDEVRITEFIALLPEHGERSFFAGISRVEPGSALVFGAGGQVRTIRHWQPTRESVRKWRREDAIEGLREQLDRAVAVRLRRAEGGIATQLSGGFDSASVTATAARLLAPTGERLWAFTSVPRAGYDGPDLPGRLGDEGPLAAATAALYPNVDHVLVRSEQGSMMRDWDRDFILLDRPVLNPCNQRWLNAIAREASGRGLKVMLTGIAGNMSVSYSGIDRLPEMVRRFQWLSLLREGRALVRTRKMRWTGVMATAFGAWLPGALWADLVRWRTGFHYRLESNSAIDSARAKDFDVATVARKRRHDFNFRPRTDAFEARLWMIGRIDPGNFNKAALAGYGIDQRDPTADRRLIEFCLSLPLEEFLANGETRLLGRRALADRLPRQVIEEKLKGHQGVDWHEGLVASREELAQEVERLSNVPSAAGALDLPRMRMLAAQLPEGGWDKPEQILNYRMTLLRGTSAGYFLRRASRSNA